MNSNNAAEEYRRMTETPVPKLITTLALPTIVSMLVTNIYNTADTYFVSRIGTSASGAVGIVFALMALYQAVGFMCGHGSGSFISRLLGMKEDDRAVTYGATAFWMSFLIGVAISAVCFLLTNPLLRMLGSTDTILPYARQYAYWIFLSGPFLTTSCTINNHLRYEGKAFYAMIGLTAGGILNTHSKVADGRREIFTAHASLCGASRGVCEQLMAADTTDACLAILKRAELADAVMESVTGALDRSLRRRCPAAGGILFSKVYGRLGTTPLAKEYERIWRTEPAAASASDPATRN